MTPADIIGMLTASRHLAALAQRLTAICAAAGTLTPGELEVIRQAAVESDAAWDDQVAEARHRLNGGD